MIRWSEEEKAWLARYWPTEPAPWLARAFERRFGRKVSESAISQKAHEMGVGKRRRSPPQKAERRVRWSEEPEKQAWMEAHDDGCSAWRLSELFRERFGFALSRPQVTAWRSANGRSLRRMAPSGPPAVPVGSERVSKGYVVVKVAPSPSVPTTKDNWRPKHIVAWEREHGPVPPGMCVFFADHDRGNFDPSNLVAVPRRLVALLNSPSCPEWRDAEGLRAAMAWCELGHAINSAEAAAPRTCAVCGREFVPEGGQAAYNKSTRAVRTCPACLAAGKKSRGVRPVKHFAACSVCGREFGATQRNQVRCPDCVRKKPKWSASQQRRCLGA